jgi:hypothetical protein
MRQRLALLALLPLTFLSACNHQPTSADRLAESDCPTYASDDLVLRIVDDAYPLGLPLVTLYGDGRVITLTRAGGVGPSPALPHLRIRSIDSNSVCRLVQMTIDAGVGRASNEYGYPLIMDDVPVTRFMVLADGVLRETSVVALFTDQGVSTSQADARQRLRDLRDQLVDLPSTLGPDAAEDQWYEPERLVAINVAYDPARGTAPARAWPGPALPGPSARMRLGPFGTFVDVACLDVTGVHVADVLSQAATANADTLWTWDGQTYEVTLRPLLPDEPSPC